MQTTHESISGDEGLHQFVTLFYNYMETLHEAKLIRDLHAKDLRSNREKLFMFLSGWIGAYDHYIVAFDYPRLRVDTYLFQ